MKAWSRFLVIGSADELLAKCSTDSHSKNHLKSKRSCGIPITHISEFFERSNSISRSGKC